MMTKEEVINMNPGYNMQHGVCDWDVKMVNDYISVISENTALIDEPQVGDLVGGAYYDGMEQYEYGRIEKIEGDRAYICYHAYVPFICRADTDGLKLSISGGPFGWVNIRDMQLQRIDLASFCDWGRCGACANGAVNFNAPVHRWFVPYVWQSKTFINVWKEEREDDKSRVTIDDSRSVGCVSLGFVSEKRMDEFLDYVGATKKLWFEDDSIKRYQLSHNTMEKSFRSMNDIPDGAKRVKLWSNGSLVDGYIFLSEHELEIYRPNPNYKDIYKPYPLEELFRVRKESGSVDF